MKLYGLASAFLHDNDDDGKLHIHCNPISMVDGKRENFEVAKDLAYKETIDLTDIEGSCRAFTRFINTWENVVKRQDAGGGKDLPVAFIAGDADFNQINLNALFVTFFGQRFSETDLDPHGLSDSEMEEFNKLLISIAEKYGDSGNKDNMIRDPDAIRCHVLMEKIGSKEKGSAKALVDKVIAARQAYLKEHGAYPLEFIEACGKLPGLLERSYYHHGRYSNSGAAEYKEPPDFTEEIKSLRKPYEEGDPKAFKRLKEIAATLGDYNGLEVTHHPSMFQLSASKNFSKDSELQAQRPELAFFHWPDTKGNLPFKAAFHKAFQNVNWHPSHRHLKLPLDGKNPLYTDPVADMMVEIDEIARGQRARCWIEPGYGDSNYIKDHLHKSHVGRLAETMHRQYANNIKRQ